MSAVVSQTIPAMLTARRKELGLSQREVGRRMTVSSATVCLLEQEKHDPRLWTLILWCKALGLELSFVEAPRYG